MCDCTRTVARTSRNERSVRLLGSQVESVDARERKDYRLIRLIRVLCGCRVRARLTRVTSYGLLFNLLNRVGQHATHLCLYESSCINRVQDSSLGLAKFS